jgi:hypothetical protein
MVDCSAEALFFGCPEEFLKQEPYGFVINRGGPSGLDTKAPHWGLAPDPLKVPGCHIALCKFVDGTPIALRYHSRDIQTN